GRVVSVTVGTVTQTATVSAGAWTTSLTSSQVKSLSEGSVTITASVSDQAGNAATAATRTVSYDKTAPTVSIGTVSGDDRINDAEDESAVTIAGTTSGAEDGRVVSVTVGTVTQTATVSAGAWTTSLTSSQVKSLSEGSVTITASVSDQAGNPATAATRTVSYDRTAPSLSIGTVSGDDRISDAEDESAVTIAGTASAEDGRVVSVTVGTVTQTATVSAGAWTTSLTSSQVKALSEGSVTITA
ncbi:Ig-like domain-containing protein, partial [Azospirillum isscasi]